mgnify:FL=1
MISDKLRSTIEDAGWRCNPIYNTDETEVTGLEIGMYSPAGEDFWFTVYGDTDKDILDEVQDAAHSFDVEEHTMENYGQIGAPGLRALLDDAEEIKRSMNRLYKDINLISFY